MEVSVLPGDRRSDLVSQVPLSIQRTLEVVESVHTQKEANALRDFDRNEIRRQIAQYMLDRGVELPPVGWYVADNIKNSRIFLIRSVGEPEVDIVGYIPYKTESFSLPYWDGMIIDLDQQDFLIPSINYNRKLITELPLTVENNNIIFHGFDQAEQNRRVRVSFGGSLQLVPYVESPHLRFWRRNGQIYCSSRARIDAWNMKATHTKTYAQIWAEMANGVSLENLFANIPTDDFCFVIQFNVPELLPYTTTNSYSIVKLTTLAIKPTGEPIPQLNIPYYPVYSLDQANNWLGFARQGDPRLTEGNAITLYDAETNSFILLRSHAYAWRANLIGPYDCTFSWAKRYLEVCNARYLPEEKYNSIFPNVIGRPLSKASDRLENISAIWTLISPLYLREEAQKLFAQYWGTDGEIAKLAKYLAVPDNFDRLSVPQRVFLAKLSERYSQSFAKNNMTKEKLYRKLFFNSDPMKPHIFGNDLYPYIREMRKQEKYLAHLEQISKST